jgi:hypothetical protein
LIFGANAGVVCSLIILGLPTYILIQCQEINAKNIFENQLFIKNTKRKVVINNNNIYI